MAAMRSMFLVVLALAGERGAEPCSEERWYLNGQPSQANENTNDNGRLTRERELDEAGRVTRDDAVFEDGSRKAFSR